jgi:hypothetical protein
VHDQRRRQLPVWPEASNPRSGIQLTSRWTRAFGSVIQRQVPLQRALSRSFGGVTCGAAVPRWIISSIGSMFL